MSFNNTQIANPKNLPNIIFLMGPTASGKTQVLQHLLNNLPVEIVSVDSAMIYRDMNIGTAKPSQQELQTVPHRLIDIIDAKDSYSSGQFCTDAATEINDIVNNKKIPLLIGGTYLYFHALAFGIAKLPQANEKIRQQLNAEAQLNGWSFLHKRLQEIDPVSAGKIHENDSQRIQRVLEIYMLTGKSRTALCAEKHSVLPYNIVPIVLAPSTREILHDRIAKRVDIMLQQGLVDEVFQLRKRADLHENLPAMRSVGYRQVWQFLESEIPKDELRDRIIFATRQLAKRQLTRFRTWPQAKWFNSDDVDMPEKLLGHIISFLTA